MKELEAIRELASTMMHTVGSRLHDPACVRCKLEALLPALEKAFADLELELQKRVCIGTRSESLTSQVMRLEAEIAALKAELQRVYKTNENNADLLKEERNVTAALREHEQLAVASARRDAIEKCRIALHSTFSPMGPQSQELWNMFTRWMDMPAQTLDALKRQLTERDGQWIDAKVNPKDKEK